MLTSFTKTILITIKSDFDTDDELAENKKKNFKYKQFELGEHNKYKI